tara:strand:+ start:7212 stop:8246 length:1035 start_codon:yes stop_codon:yes gene_type:complete
VNILRAVVLITDVAPAAYQGGAVDKFDRFQLLHRQFRCHRLPVPISRLATALECSEKTVKRTIEQMQSYLDAPIQYFPDYRGWHYAEQEQDLYQLPGLWLTAAELQSLALLMQLLNTFGNGLLNEELAVMARNVDKLLAARGIEQAAFERHIKVLPLSHRHIANPVFVQVCEAVLKQQRIEMEYRSYNRKVSRRTVSPQTLVYYRENWYLDAWCHLRNDLRTFSLARIRRLTTSKEPALAVDQAALGRHFEQGYGIFSGPAKQRAVLRFLPDIAHEIALQQWHPQQEGKWDGADYLLTLPYSDERELVQDILRHIPHVFVEQPAILRQALKVRLQAGLDMFSSR